MVSQRSGYIPHASRDPAMYNAHRAADAALSWMTLKILYIRAGSPGNRSPDWRDERYAKCTGARAAGAGQ